MAEIDQAEAEMLLRKKALTRWERIRCSVFHDWTYNPGQEWRVCDRCFVVERKVLGTWHDPDQAALVERRRNIAAAEMERMRDRYLR
jgi:hypothetical protein